MKCQICNKNEAQIVFTQIVDNEKIVMQICTECAMEKGLSIDFESSTKLHGSHEKSLENAISVDTPDKNDSDTLPDIECANCGMSFREFKKTGLFGCDECHEFFSEEMSSILKEIHGTDAHVGESKPRKVSKAGALKRSLKELRSELKRVIEREEYERAAELRDKIAELEKGNKE